MNPAFTPRHVLLFSGHRIDSPDRNMPRFTPAMLPAAKRRIDEALDILEAGPLDLALCQAAAGGDLLFLEACHARSVRCEVMLPFEEAVFVQRSIMTSIDAAQWRQRWLALKSELAIPPQTLPVERGSRSSGHDEYERCNLWLLEAAIAHGSDKLCFLCLWDGLEGDGPGGVQHMMNEALRLAAGRVTWIDTRTLL